MAGTLERISRFRDLPLETVPCYVCGETRGRTLVDDPPFRVVRCAGCGLGYTSPRLAGDRIHEIYGEDYWKSQSAQDYGYACYEGDVSGYLRTFRKKADLVRRHQPSGRLLEVGCAAGYFLSVMRDLGYEVHGVEVSADILARARRRFRLQNLHQGKLQNAPLPDRHFHVIAMWDVVEHLADPLVELHRCRRLIRDDGILVLQTQDLNTFFRRLLGSRWHHFKQLEHLYHFTPATIRTLLGRAGFQVLKLTHTGAGKFVSFDFIAERASRLGRVAGWLASPLKLLGRRFLYINPRDEMIVVARPRTGTADP